MSLSCGQAAVGIIANSLAAKLSMSVMWRNPKANPLQFTTPAFKNHSSAQLNEAEYAPSASSSPLVFLLGLPLVSLSLCFVVFLSCLTVLSFFFLAFFSFPFLSFPLSSSSSSPLFFQSLFLFVTQCWLPCYSTFTAIMWSVHGVQHLLLPAKLCTSGAVCLLAR